MTASLITGVASTPVATGAPDPAPRPPPGLAELADQVIAWLRWGVLAAGMVGLVVCAGMIIVGRRHRGGLAHDGVLGSLWVLGGLALAASAALVVGAFARAGDP